MGSCNPKPQKPIPPQGTSLQLCCKRLRYHLQIKQNKINQEIIATESQLVARINANTNQRNKIQELLIAERIVNGLKYTAVYTLLMEYAASIGSFASFICQNINDQSKTEPWQHKIYSIMYAAQKMPLNTLQQFRKCMNYVDDEILMQQHADKQVKNYLTQHPTPEEMNMYMLEMSQRNRLPLEKINQAGHTFSPNFKPTTWENQFKTKSSQFRNSLPKDMVGVNNFNQNKSSGRASMSNPFDKSKMVEQKRTDPNAEKELGPNSSQKLDNDDISPNITDIMKGIGNSEGQTKKSP